jgi:hypothetical protein
MKKMIAILVFFILTFTFFGCRQHIDISDYINQKSPLEIKIGNQLKRPDTIKVKSYKYRKLIEWGKNNTDNWQLTPACYITEIYVGQGKFRLLYTSGTEGVVIGFTDKNGKSYQYCKATKKGELDFLKEK